MEKPTYSQLRQQMFAAWSAGDYAAALSTVDDFAAAFPEQSWQYPFWRACLLARLGRPADALAELEAGLAAGYWWAPARLRSDEDLAALQDQPRFQAVLALCEQKLQAANAQSRPECDLHLPPAGAEGAPLLVVLHGWGGNRKMYAPEWSAALKAGWGVAMLQSSQVTSCATFGWDDVARAGDEIAAQVSDLLRAHNFDANRVVLAGFSQGGGEAIRLAFEARFPVRGYLAVAPARLDMKELEDSPRGVAPRGVLLAGEADQRWADLAEQTADWLAARRLPHWFSLYPGLGHNLPPDFMDELPGWLAFIEGEAD